MRFNSICDIRSSIVRKVKMKVIEDRKSKKEQNNHDNAKQTYQYNLIIKYNIYDKIFIIFVIKSSNSKKKVKRLKVGSWLLKLL